MRGRDCAGIVGCPRVDEPRRPHAHDIASRLPRGHRYDRIRRMRDAPPRQSGIVAAPDWRVGDGWTYRRIDGYTKLNAGSPVTRRVAEVGATGIRVSETTASNTYINDALYENPGAMRMGTLSEFGPIIGRFEPPLQY